MPQSKAFTDRYLAALKGKPVTYDVVDAARKGLVLRLFPSGAKSFLFRFKRNRASKRITLGQYPTMPLRAAYEAHAELTKRLNRGEDLLAGKPVTLGVEGEPVDTGRTVGDLAGEFVRRYINKERKRPREAEQLIEANILKSWRHKPAKHTTRREGVLLLDKIVDRGCRCSEFRILGSEFG